jgi:succinoglycan biosynthesis protein ExoM
MHISICVCTYRRPALLERLLEELVRQETHGLFTYSVVVVDNDPEQSASAVTVGLAQQHPIPIAYHAEPERGIARARNRAVQSAQGDFVAFIDDDEQPIREWLLLLFLACTQRGVDGVLGPVKPHFDTEPPRWISRGRFYERADYPTGSVIDGGQGRTGNVLLRRNLFRPGELAFRPEFVTGEDQDFFRRRIAEGRVFIWCSEAIAYETVPPTRWTRSYIVRKALMRGRYSAIEPTFGLLDWGKSVAAIFVYTLVLPAAGLVGQHQLMRYIEKLCYHAGKVLASMRITPVGTTYVSE